jgi:phage/plasmid-associated DNA primase
MVMMAVSVHRVSADPVEADRWINVRNGLVEWPTGQLYSHLPEACGVTQLPIERSDDAECPVFTEFLAQVLPEDCLVPTESCPAGFIWEVIGYAIYSGIRCSGPSC